MAISLAKVREVLAVRVPCDESTKDASKENISNMMTEIFDTRDADESCTKERENGDERTEKLSTRLEDLKLTSYPGREPAKCGPTIGRVAGWSRTETVIENLQVCVGADFNTYKAMQRSTGSGHAAGNEVRTQTTNHIFEHLGHELSEDD